MTRWVLPSDYRPKPVETAGIELDASIEPLIELLARNVHDLWAQERLAQGWTYGPARDDSKEAASLPGPVRTVAGVGEGSMTGRWPWAP